MKLLLILSITSLLITTACSEQNKKEENLTQIETQKAYIEPKLLPSTTREKIANQNKEDKLLHKIGIHTENDKIIIEPKKTKEFLENIAKNLEQDAKKFTKKAKEIKESTLGIKASKDKVIIDLNKTKSFLETFSKEFENIAKDISKNIDIK